METTNPIIQFLSLFLPTSPVQTFLVENDITSDIRQFLGYLNWFIPVGTILTILSLWLVAIGLFYLVQWILRTYKIIGD